MANLFFKRLRENATTGFTAVNAYQGGRVLNRDGSLNIKRKGLNFWDSLHLFHELIHMPWWKFNLYVIGTYLVLNLFFTLLYGLVGFRNLSGHIDSDNLNDFWEAFFFSTQTISTVGYGRMNPTGFGANVIASIESLVGLLGFALATGLLYGRFSRPVSDLIYSHNGLISPFKDGTAFMFRVANKKKSIFIEPEVEVLLSLNDENNTRRFFNLPLELKRVNYLTLSWTVVHNIDENSPLNGLTHLDLTEMDIEILITLKGFDTTFGTIVYSNHSYKYHEIVFGAKFKPVFHPSEDGMHTVLELNKINDYELVEIPIASKIPLKGTEKPSVLMGGFR